MDPRKTIHFMNHVQPREVNSLPVGRRDHFFYSLEDYTHDLKQGGVATIRMLYGDHGFSAAAAEAGAWYRTVSDFNQDSIATGLDYKQIPHDDVLWVKVLDYDQKKTGHRLATSSSIRSVGSMRTDGLIKALRDADYQNAIFTGVKSSACVSRHLDMCLAQGFTCYVATDHVGCSSEEWEELLSPKECQDYNVKAIKEHTSGDTSLVTFEHGAEITRRIKPVKDRESDPNFDLVKKLELTL